MATTAELAARASTTAELAARAGLPRIKPDNSCTEAELAITWAAVSEEQKQASSILGGWRLKPFPTNAVLFPPPSLDKFRTAASRAPADAAPVLWYWQMTGETWDRQTHSYRVCFRWHLKLCRLLTRWLDLRLAAGEEGALADAAREHYQGARARGQPEEARPNGRQREAQTQGAQAAARAGRAGRPALSQARRGASSARARGARAHVFTAACAALTAAHAGATPMPSGPWKGRVCR